MNEVRSRFSQINSEEDCEAFIKFCDQVKCDAAVGYKATATMQMAEFAFMPNSKWSYFKKGKAILENHIKTHPKDLEARYMRVMIQLNAPAMLNYNEDYKSDYALIKKEIGSSSLPKSYQKTILDTIKKELNK
ncbi:hypothetical protein [Jiulongibacter sp. NS-SX5]|uniref:hypothetical protein n=1 Tax=Jiulongibacter sp. NS-SX5 TaxID=3463854 RepID=UPI0040596EE7